MSLEKEKISFSYPIINITAEGARSWGWWKKAWDRGFVSRVCDPHLHGEPQQWGSLTVFSLQVSPLTIFAVKDRNPSILSFARRGLSKHPAYCPQSKSTHNVKYCMYNFFWFSFFFSPQVLQSNQLLQWSESAQGIFFTLNNNNSPKSGSCFFAELYYCYLGLIDWLSVFSARNRNANQGFSTMELGLTRLYIAQIHVDDGFAKSHFCRSFWRCGL